MAALWTGSQVTAGCRNQLTLQPRSSGHSFPVLRMACFPKPHCARQQVRLTGRRGQPSSCSPRSLSHPRLTAVRLCSTHLASDILRTSQQKRNFITPWGVGGGGVGRVCRAARVQGSGQQTWRLTPSSLTLSSLSILIGKTGSQTLTLRGQARRGQELCVSGLGLWLGRCLPGKVTSSLWSSGCFSAMREMTMA